MLNKRFPTIVFLAAIITRLNGFGASAIWYDEAISRYRASLPLSNLLTNISEWQGVNLWEFILVHLYMVRSGCYDYLRYFVP